MPECHILIGRNEAKSCTLGIRTLGIQVANQSLCPGFIELEKFFKSEKKILRFWLQN